MQQYLWNTGFGVIQGFFCFWFGKKSEMLTAMLTSCGAYVFNFLPMGCSCSSNLFESWTLSYLTEQGRMTKIIDDILCYGAEKQDYQGLSDPLQ